jgi:ubiquinone/menaquinone biosynthesis C-methylase UbiE
MSAISAEEVKSCCAAAYSSDAVALLMGESYHPGGLALTRHLAGRLGLSAGSRALDVASGRGTSALLLAAEFGAHVDGVDLSEANVAVATDAAHDLAVSERVRFVVGDAERLPVGPGQLDGGYDAVICECALCTFPDKAAAASEFARALRPGGRVGITDVIADRARLPAELTSLAAWVACVADARTMDGYAAILEESGLAIIGVERHDAAVLRMIEQIEARLAVARITARERLEAAGIDLAHAAPVLAAARQAVGDGVLGYGLFVAERRV